MRSSNLNITALVLACFLAGCDSGEFSDPPLEYQGYFGFYQTDYNIQIFAEFAKQTITTPVSDFKANWMETDDSCTVKPLTPYTDPEQQNNQDTAEAPAKISAGETLTITSEFGTFATLARSASNLYSAELEQDTAPPYMWFDIPGDDFPALSNIAIPQAPPVEFIQAIEAVTPTTTFVWVANDKPYSAVFVSALGYHPMTGTELEVRCILMDDGSFSFPENIQLQMGNEFTSFYFFVARNTTTFVRHDNALLIIDTAR